MGKDGIVLREEDLYKPIYNYLTGLGYTVRSEVKHCDVVGEKDGEILIVEMKKSLNLDVILQGVLRQRLSNTVYLAVPKPGKIMFSKRWKNLCYLLRRLELGLMVVSFQKDKSSVQILFEPETFDLDKSRKSSKRKRESMVKEFQARYGDYNTGGSKGKKLTTAYREAAIHIACCLLKCGHLSPKQLRTVGTTKDKTQKILYDNHYNWFQKISRGVYGLTEQGKLELDNYGDLVDYYMGLIPDILE